MTQSRKESILNHVKRKTDEVLAGNFSNHFDTNALNISLDLQIDRANTSKDLNSLWREGLLIKITERPVLYIHYQSLIQKYNLDFLPSMLGSQNELTELLSANHGSSSPADKQSPLSNLIGSLGSLTQSITQARASLSYPPHGIHTLIYGERGVGKSEFALQMLQEYSSSEDKKINHQIIDCGNYSGDSIGFNQLLLGVKSNVNDTSDTRSILERAQNSILVLENIDLLPADSLRLVKSLLRNESFSRLGDTKIIPLHTMIIATQSKSDSDILVDQDPIFTTHIHLQSLENRGVFEKLELILFLLSREAIRIQKQIRLSKDIIVVLANHIYERNIVALRDTIRIACAHAYLDNQNVERDYITIDYHNLPDELLSTTNQLANKKLKSMFFLASYPHDSITFNHDGTSQLFNYVENIDRSFLSFDSKQYYDSFISQYDNSVDLSDYVKANIDTFSNFNPLQLSAIKKSINHFVYQTTLSTFKQSHDFRAIAEVEHLFSSVVLHISNQIKRMQVEPNFFDDTPSKTKEKFPKAFALSSEIYETLSRMFDIHISTRDLDFLTNYIVICQHIVSTNHKSLLIICHGKSIASEMKEILESTFNKQLLIESIDFTNDMQLNDCIELACVKAASIDKGSGVVIATDMNPIQSISDYVFKETGVITYSIENVSLPKLIIVSNQIIQNRFQISEFTNEPLDLDRSFQGNEYIFEVVNQVIKQSVNFIDVEKSVGQLMESLSATLQLLSIPYDDGIAVKYLCHSINMLERVITNNALRYDGLKAYVAQHQYTVHSVEEALKPTANAFGIKIPTEEIAYISEIFTEL